MSAYSGRRGPNVSQYLRDLNMVPQESSPEETTFGLDDEQLAMWSNNYFDFDGATSQADLKVDLEPQSATSPTSPAIGDPSFDFVASGDFNFDFGAFNASQPVGTIPEGMGALSALQPNPQPFGSGGPQNSYSPPNSQTGDNAKADAPAEGRALTFEEQSRLAAEEDKRRRNTAASARFRVKKKAREQALEKRERELSEKVSRLEARVQHLETENKWLREMVMEKTGGTDTILSAVLKDRKKTKADPAENGEDPEPRVEAAARES